nr:ABC transporter permease [Brevibacterium daeguense]
MIPIAVVAAAVVLLPLVGMLARLPMGQFLSLITSVPSLEALRLSLITASSAAVLCVLLGVPLAVTLVRIEFPGRQLARAFVLLPLVLPPVVGGLALLYTFGRRGVVGAPLSAVGIDIAFSTIAVVLAQIFVSMPFVVITIESALLSMGTKYEIAAASLGASPWRSLLMVTVPSLMPAILSGGILAFARSLGEFGATITFAGSLQGVTRTLPLEIYLQREADPDAAIALSVLLVLIAVVIVASVYRLPARYRGLRP